MIKPIYLLSASLLILTACSQNEIEPLSTFAGEPIVFRNSLPTVATRADIVRKGNMDYFYVTAFNPDSCPTYSGPMTEHFPSTRINSSVGSSRDCRWPEQGHESDKLRFFAFYPALEGEAKIENNSLVYATTPVYNYKITNYAIRNEIAKQVDFVTATTTASMEDSLFSGVTLPFLHQLSRIEVKAFSDHKSCDIEIAGVRIGGIPLAATFNFKSDEAGGFWTEQSKRDSVEYIYKPGDTVVTLAKRCEDTNTAEKAVSIMGSKITDKDENCAMLIPSENTPWEFDSDRHNEQKRMYISVLLRVTDATETAGERPKDPVRYPYHDNNQGFVSQKIPVVYLAVDEATNEVKARVYRQGEQYYKDTDFSDEYELREGIVIKDFGWAALPVSGNWSAGKIYTYTLNYSYGVGVHDPGLSADAVPGAGDAIISDKVGISYTVTEWKSGGGSSFEVPGS